MSEAHSVGIIGCGKCLPRTCVTNAVLGKECHVSPDWIESRTGIRSRYYANLEETASILAAKAAERAIENANISKSDIGLIICCSYSTDYLFPSLACKVQQMLKVKRCGAFDLSAGSAGFEIGLTVAADRLGADSELKNVVVIASAVQSHFLDRADPKTAVLFGDAACAA
ncbi:MAG: ketoacyl-ACP synthase III, partial [Candidatus Omnitrophica bacterium]|nr:ketoacyl-ACP synthase III [Candidatus Omnitrophota bacterium]